jgi:hypothetical protein
MEAEHVFEPGEALVIRQHVLEYVKSLTVTLVEKDNKLPKTQQRMEDKRSKERKGSWATLVEFFKIAGHKHYVDHLGKKPTWASGTGRPKETLRTEPAVAPVLTLCDAKDIDDTNDIDELFPQVEVAVPVLPSALPVVAPTSSSEAGPAPAKRLLALADIERRDSVFKEMCDIPPGDSEEDDEMD